MKKMKSKKLNLISVKTHINALRVDYLLQVDKFLKENKDYRLRTFFKPSTLKSQLGYI